MTARSLLALLGSGAVAVVACRAVPDLVFIDADAAVLSDGGSSSSSSSSSSGSSGSGDASTDSGDAAAITCPQGPPASATACCGAIPCVGDCAAVNCAKCMTDCSGTQKCCGKPNMVLCRALDANCP